MSGYDTRFYFRCADLAGAHLEDTLLDYAEMSDADLTGCHIEGASLWTVNPRQAYCDGAHFEDCDLWNAHLDDAFLYRAYFQRARLHEAYLPGTHFTDLHLARPKGVCEVRARTQALGASSRVEA
jgi:uncharacterized protein YjbI with pentapeptide repeats